jgi:hypothetical protein
MVNRDQERKVEKEVKEEAKPEGWLSPKVFRSGRVS